MLENLKKDLRRESDPDKAAFFPGFFKASYLVNDNFLGVTVPKQRSIAKKYSKELSLEQILKLLHSQWHEERLTALFMLVLHFEKGDEPTRLRIVNSYLANSKWVDNWDLVDSSAYSILGVWLLDKDRSLLYKLVKSKNLWERRMSIVATMVFIRKNDTADTYKIAELLLTDKEDYIHKAVGWLLREAGKKDKTGLRRFLDKHSKVMPRTMLRYAIERFEGPTRAKYLQLK